MTCLHRFGRTRDAAWRVETNKMAWRRCSTTQENA
jgi:hypothetical protein